MEERVVMLKLVSWRDQEKVMNLEEVDEAEANEKSGSWFQRRGDACRKERSGILSRASGWSSKSDNRWRASTARRLERYQVRDIGRLIAIKEFEGERENFVLNTFIDFKPVKRYEIWGMSESGGPDNSTRERVLNQLESM